MRTSVIVLVGLAFALATGCVTDDPEGPGVDDGKTDAWDSANNPARFGNEYEYNWENLREHENGASEIVPWPDTYWPMTEDGYNARWRGSDILSPAELYDQAFNGWTPPEGFMELRPYRGHGMAWDAEYYDALGPAASWAHDRGGNSRGRNIHNPDGSFTEAIDADRDGVVDRDLNGDGEMDNGDDEGGLEGWFGHCHAWAPAAYFAPEPQHSVTVNGVEFTVSDIKAMIEATHEGCGGTLFLGGRCNLRDLTRDEYGRVVETECRDTNAGAFHVVLLNVVGRLGRSFVADITTDYQVWNHPVRDYSVDAQMEVTEAEALSLLNRTDVDSYPYNDQAERFVHVETTFRYVVEGSASTGPYIPTIDSYTRSRRYEYLLELDGDGDIIGGEWISDNQPDFLWSATRSCDVRPDWYQPAVVSVANVQTLIDLSTSTEPPPPEGEEHAFDSEPTLSIPDDDEAGVSDTITVSDDLQIAGVRVALTIPHTYIGDLVVELEHGGQTVTLHDREGSGQDDLVASFTPDEWNGGAASGDWTLRVRDLAGADTGTLQSWRLTVISQ